MGCYDTVHVVCPSCGTRLNFQSKAGKCRLDDFTADEVPAVIAVDLNGYYKKCTKCDKTVTISVPCNIQLIRMMVTVDA